MSVWPSLQRFTSLVVVAIVGVLWIPAVGADQEPPVTRDPESREAVNGRCEVYKRRGAGCECPTRTEMAEKYFAGMVSFTSRQLVGFKNNWDRRDPKPFSEHAVISMGAQWMDRFLSQHVAGASPKVAAVHLDVSAGRVLVLPDPNMSGHMTVYHARPAEFLVAAELLDQYLCTSNQAAAVSKRVSAGVTLELLAAVERADGLFVDPDVALQVRLAYWDSLAIASRPTIAGFQASDPHDYETAVVGRALFASSVEEAVQAWSSPATTETFTLDGLGLGGIQKERPSQQTRKEIEHLLAGLNKPGADVSRYIAELSPESRDLLQKVVDKSRQAAVSPLIDNRIVSNAVEDQAELYPSLQLPIELINR